MHIGHQFLWQEFKIKPKVGWMIDAFGHSEANAALFADFGFEALFFTRASTELREQLKKEKKLHFVWTPFSKNSGTERQILTHVYHGDLYGYLPELGYEERENDADPLVANKERLDYNAEEKCVHLINAAQDAASDQLHSSDLLMLHGGDFGYQNAQYNFAVLDKIIDTCNNYQQVNMTFQYSTPMRYYDALKAESQIEWPVLDHDFFPYHMRQQEAWSGYYTSRAGAKKQAKDYSNLYHAQASLFARKVID